MIHDIEAKMLSYGLPDKVTKRYQHSIKNAVILSQTYHSETIDCRHLLSGLLQIRNGVAYHVLQNLGFETDVLADYLQSFPHSKGTLDERISQDAIIALRRSVDWMRSLGNSHLDTEHLLLAIIEHEEIQSFIASCGVVPGDILHEIRRLHGLLS